MPQHTPYGKGAAKTNYITASLEDTIVPTHLLTPYASTMKTPTIKYATIQKPRE